MLVSGPAAAARVTPSGVATTAAGPVADAALARLEGIDVSHWQNTINWTKVAAAGKSFAIIKATDGILDSSGRLYVDPLYATNHANAKAAGIWTGAYHYARPDATANDAKIEADWFASKINLGGGDLRPALDLEESGGLSAAALQAWVIAFMDEATTRIGMRPMIYTSPNFWKTYMGNTQKLADLGYKTLWIAHWNISAPTIPANNWGGHGWTFWQYSDCGSVSGISGCVDLDRFNGADLTPQAFSAFKLSAAGGTVKQGKGSSTTVAIARTNFQSEIALDVSGLPAGTTATFDSNPTTDSAATITVTTPTDPTATPTGTYPLRVTGVADGITRTTTLNLVVADGIGPTVAAPRTTLLTKRTLGTSTVPVRVSWAASDPSGIARTPVQRSVNGGGWTSVAQSSPTVAAADDNLPTGASVRHHVRATDRLANTSGWATGSAVRTAVYQQTSGSITWGGTWHTAGSTSASGRSLRYATGSGASATFRFTGSGVAWVAPQSSGRGSARVLVDGVYAATVSLRTTASHSRQIVFAKNWPTNATHTVKIVVLGTKGHARVDVDAFVRLTTG